MSVAVEKFASVILDDGIDQELDYAVPCEWQEKAAVGVRVVVPMRGQLKSGTILSLKTSPSVAQVKPIHAITSEKPLISSDLFELGSWMADYYCSPLRKILRLFLPPPLRKGMGAKQQLFVSTQKTQEELAQIYAEYQKKHPAQAKILAQILSSPEGVLLAELLQRTKVAQSTVMTLVKKGILICELVEIERDPLESAPYFLTKNKTLSEAQANALRPIVESLQGGKFETHLIHGVTGSGKTEVYLQAMEQALLLGKSTIFLVPEIALTSQTVERIRSRFTKQVALIHHRLSDGEKRDTWHAMHRGETRIAIGPRSCIFCPMDNLGLIVIDEEHDHSYKQTDEIPCYHARDAGIMRAKLLDATVILGSATPSLESYHNGLQSKYRLHTLPERAHQAHLPTVKIVDLRREKEKQKGNTLFSSPLIDALEKRLKCGEQSLLFLNRRGYHSLHLCKSCGKTTTCPHCDVSMTYHKGIHTLACHLCQYELSPPPRECTHCKSEDCLQYRGAGTEQVERVLHALFPDVRTLRADADTTRNKGSHERLFKEFRSGKADVLIGTQMIAKGLHFPSVTLVGVLNADSSLQVPDFRSSEKVFQLITQVAGRSGRGSLPGEVIIQSFLPDHPAIQFAANQDYLGFYHQEWESRKLFSYPPFARLVKVAACGEKEQQVQTQLESIRQKLIVELPPIFELQPVIPCGHAKVKDEFYFHFLIKGPSCLPVSRALQKISCPRSLRLLIDIDPLSTFF